MRSLILNVVFVVWTIGMAAAALVAAWFRGPDAVRGFLRRWALGAQALTRALLRARIDVQGLERFGPGERPALIVSKHQSELDTFIPLALYPDLGAIAMRELERYPLIGPIIRKLGYILVTVDGGRANHLRQVMEGARRVHAEGRPILIYPEGELMRIGARQRYKTGAFHIYEALGCEATPVALCTGLVWPKREWTKNVDRTAVVAFLNPIPPGLDKASFMREVETRIETGTMALIRAHGTPEEIAAAEARFRAGLTNSDEESVLEHSWMANPSEPDGGDLSDDGRLSTGRASNA